MTKFDKISIVLGAAIVAGLMIGDTISGNFFFLKAWFIYTILKRGHSIVKTALSDVEVTKDFRN